MPKLTLNGKEIEVPAGSTIIEAYKQLDEPIAHYCWHPGLSIAGVCRLCVVEIEGNPRLQIACNTQIQEGMVVNNNSEKVKTAVKWGLDFHLINHPLDCPICDQAGECELQNQYMEFGKYDPEMAEPKVKKRKVVDLGERVVLDTERCILCSRCVRFTNEVSKTNELGIFNRGDRSEVGTFEDKPLNNKYSVNTVDICPVGALTSKDFRFKQRVWYLKNKPSICTGCSTGCNVNVYYNEEGVFRVKPHYNKEVNGYWMCDEGRDIYKHINRKSRMLRGRYKQNGVWCTTQALEVAKKAGQKLSSFKGEEIAVLVTGQYTNEELNSLVDYSVNKLGSKSVFHWKNNENNWQDFDGHLIRGDKNPNTKGLQGVLQKYAVGGEWKELENQLSKFKAVVVAGPENQSVYFDIKEKIESLKSLECVVWFTAGENSNFEKLSDNSYLIPQKTSVEKNGHFTNHQGLTQKVEEVTTILPEALNLEETVSLMLGNSLDLSIRDKQEMGVLKTNYFSQERGSL
ncbi:MAG: (2Fe-2S)-binding protein [Bdellovibrionaceae bacterium]|nr:(2Fe-2S)-binding protein [Pseudobdellovibrionaceae bacterium]